MNAPSSARPVHAPTSSYRLQFHRDFTFRDAERLVPYIDSLGAGDIYCSPYLMARPGSRHGYDIIDHTKLNPEVGSEEEYRSFVNAIHQHGLGQLLDFVPNHMGIDPATNAWWRDVLENGPSSLYGRFFDIDWHPVKTELNGKVLLPILGEQYGIVLESGQLRLGYRDGLLHLDYFDHCLPINPRRSAAVYERNIEALRSELGDDNADLLEFLSIITELKNLPDYMETDPERVAHRHREKLVARDRLTRLVARSPRIARHIEEAVTAFNGEPGKPDTFDSLHALLEEQPYRLAYWRTAAHEINYRRFFDINDLAGIRMEDADVFAATHQLIQKLIAERAVDGLRIDHPDGLYDPEQYFARVQEMAAGALDAQSNPKPLYLLAEKILSAAEELPSDWRINGTTGYNFLNELNGLFVDPSGARPMRRIYRRITHQMAGFDEVVYQCKKLITRTSLASELNVLAHALNVISEANRRSRDFTLNSLRDVLGEVVACFPVYRTYVSATGWTQSDRRIIETAIRRARKRNPALEPSAWDFLREVLLPRQVEEPAAPGDSADSAPERRISYPPPTPEEHRQRLHFAMRFQQYTAPVQAKGVEDTAFYRYNLLVSLNEVGGDPGRFGRSLSDFHETNKARLAHWPLEMTATATHDTKLGEDVRARINVLSELVDEWRRVLARWMRINAGNRTRLEADFAPERNDEYRFYQVLVGTWPAESLANLEVSSAPEGYVERLVAYMNKATKEAKARTSWINDNEAYDKAMSRFVNRTLSGPSSRKFLSALLPFARRVAHYGMLNSLSQLALKIACPGVPDFYQGTELWDLHLVDPDNRAEVDYARRAELMKLLQPLLHPTGSDEAAVVERARSVGEMANCWTDGRIKLYLTATGMRVRREHPELFLWGEYLPIDADGQERPADVVSFARRWEAQVLIVVAPRLVTKLCGESELPIGERWDAACLRIPDQLAGTYVNALTGETVTTDASGMRIADALRTCPVALLLRR